MTILAAVWEATPVKRLTSLWVNGLPIFGWFALGGFGIKIIKNLVKGKIKEVPEWGNAAENFMIGLVVCLKYLPLLIVVMIISSIVSAVPNIGWLLSIAFTVIQIIGVTNLF